MHTEAVRKLALSRIPAVAARVVPGTRRQDVVAPLPPAGSVGIELGVAQGALAGRLMRSGRFAHLFGVDFYGGGHGLRDYRMALAEVGLLSPYTLLRMRFDQALEMFPEAFFDFVYCDGHAHSGQEGGRTLVDWYARLKPGGVMAGDDYNPEVWPLTVWAVNHLAVQVGAELMLTDVVEAQGSGRHRSWFFVRPPDGAVRTPPQPCAELVALAEEESARIDALRKARRVARRAGAAQR